MTSIKSGGQMGDNVALLSGKVIRPPETRALPSGDELVEFRISVPRSGRGDRGRTVVDWFDCAAWTAATRRKVSNWAVGDLVEVSGSLRTRHYVVGGAGRTAVSLEVRNARRVLRADGKQSGRAQAIKKSADRSP